VPGPAIGFLQHATRWWDRWLKGIPNGAEGDPAMRLFLRDAAAPDPCMADMPGEWVETGWPVAQGRTVHLAGAALADRPGPVARTVASPPHLGLTAGEYFPMGLDGEMAGDQRADDALSVCFDGAVLEAPLVLAGRAVVRLRVASDRPLGFVVARLNAVMPDGASMRIAHGMLNLCHRVDRAAPQPMVPGQAEDISIILDLAAVRLEPGMRLRLALSNAYWPFLWPSPQAGAVSVTGGSLTLPEVDPATLTPWQPPAPQAAAPAEITVTGARAARRIEHDLTTGTRTLVVEDDSGWRDHADTGWRTRALTVERWSIRDGDPLSATAEIRWHQQFARDGWEAETEATSRLTATADALVFHAATEARANGAVVHQDSETREVPRRFV
jgi:uncharacterized protein